MRNDAYIPAIAALAAGGLLIVNYARRRRRAELYLDTFADTALKDLQLRIPAGTALLGSAALVAGGLMLSRELRRGPGETSTIEESITVDVPVSTAYNQWTQFEEFPKFMSTVESVRQVDDTHLHWRARVGGQLKEWDAEITEQIPDQRIAWRSTGDSDNAGVVTFHKVSESRTRVMLQMDYTPKTLSEKLADAGGAVKMTARGNLKRFKQLLESRGAETGAWRGTVTQH
jgi:uncharacterized membrane protein